MSRTVNKRRTNPGVVNVAIPLTLKKEMESFALEAGLRLKQVPAVLWRAFKTLPPEQRENEAKQFRRELAHADSVQGA
jgi:hypothetical protein